MSTGLVTLATVMVLLGADFWACTSSRPTTSNPTPTSPFWLEDRRPPSPPPGRIRALMAQGRRALSRGDYATAAQAFESARRRAPEIVAVDTEWAMALRALGRPGAALDRLVAPMSSPQPWTRLRARLVRINALMDLGDVAAAWRESSGVVTEYPDLLDGHYALARALVASGKRVQALEAFDTVRRHAPNHVGAHIGALAALSTNPAGVDYRTLERQILHRWPRHPDVHVIRGIARELMGQHDDAIAAFREALSLDARHPTANFNLARLLEDRQGLDAAKPYYLRFVESASGPRRAQADRLRKRLRNYTSPGGKPGPKD